MSHEWESRKSRKIWLHVNFVSLAQLWYWWIQYQNESLQRGDKISFQSECLIYDLVLFVKKTKLANEKWITSVSIGHTVISILFWSGSFIPTSKYNEQTCVHEACVHVISNSRLWAALSSQRADMFSVAPFDINYQTDEWLSCLICTAAGNINPRE